MVCRWIMFDRDAAALTVIQVEQCLRRLATQDGDELLDEFTASCTPPLRPIPPSGLLMRGIPGEQDAALAEGLRDALVHAVQRRVLDGIVVPPGHHTGKARAGEFRRHHLLVGNLGLHREHGPPDAGDAQREEPLLGVRVIGHVGKARDQRGEIELGGKHEEALGPGEALDQGMAADLRTALRAPSAPMR